MRGYILPTTIALLLAAPLLWRVDSELSMPNQVVGVAPAELAAAPQAEPRAPDGGGVRLLAVVPVATDDEAEAEALPAERRARVWTVGYGLVDAEAERD